MRQLIYTEPTIVIRVSAMKHAVLTIVFLCLTLGALSYVAIELNAFNDTVAKAMFDVPVRIAKR